VNPLHIEILRKNIATLTLSAEWVKRSYEKAKAIPSRESYSAEEFDTLEVLSSRYARTTDMLVNKVLRSIDTVESEDSGTIIDIMNRAEKRGIVESAALLHTIKDLRNNIVHEYQIDEITRFFGDVLTYSPLLLAIIEKTKDYCRKYLEKT
jgi:uncharacterized protein YutE (UPF0331/DUF86 family)